MRAFKWIVRFLAKQLNREVVMRLGSEKRSEHINAWVDESTMRWLESESKQRQWTLSQTIHWYLSKCANTTQAIEHICHKNEESPVGATTELGVQITLEV